MKKIYILFITALLSYNAFAQQDAMFTHYMFNTLAVNPAYAGSRNALTLTALHRSQWVAFDGAPTTQTFTMHSPIIKQNIGLGFSFINDKIGPVDKTSFFADFSYTFKISEKGKLSMGIKGGLNIMSVGLSDLNVEDAYDPVFDQNIKSKLLPNFGFGIYYHTDRYYAGISTPSLLEVNFDDNTVEGSANLFSEKRHYFFIAGAVFNLNETGSIKIKPTTYVKMTNGAPLEVDLTATFIFQDKFWAGPMMRTGDAVGVIAGLNITNQLSAGYSFDWSFTNKTFSYNLGSHEIMLRYDFVKVGNDKVLSPRYF